MWHAILWWGLFTPKIAKYIYKKIVGKIVKVNEAQILTF